MHGNRVSNVTCMELQLKKFDERNRESENTGMRNRAKADITEMEKHTNLYNVSQIGNKLLAYFNL